MLDLSMLKRLLCCSFFLLFCYGQAQSVEVLEKASCPDCQPGEIALRLSATVEPAFSAIDIPPCKEDLFEKIPHLLKGLANSQTALSFTTKGAKNRLIARFVDNLDNDIRHQLANRIDETVSACVVLGIVLPLGSSYQGFGLSVTSQTSGKTQLCDVQGFCKVPFATFSMTPKLFNVGDRQVIVTEFRNYNSDTFLEDESFQAHLTVYYLPE